MPCCVGFNFVCSGCFMSKFNAFQPEQNSKKELVDAWNIQCEEYQKLSKKCVELEQAQPKWISVDDGLPETEQLVLVGCKLFSNVNFVLNVAYYCTARDRFVLVDSTFSWYEINPDDEFFRDGFYDDDEDMAKVTHWMPLLQPPEVK